MRNKHGYRRLAYERKPARHHFIHHDAKRIKVTSRVYFESARLLGAYVINGTYRLVYHRERFRFRNLRYAEIRHLDIAALCKHDILRLDIAMDDALAVRMTECGEYLNGKFHRFAP